jgi:hypothetical protein
MRLKRVGDDAVGVRVGLAVGAIDPRLVERDTAKGRAGVHEPDSKRPRQALDFRPILPLDACEVHEQPHSFASTLDIPKEKTKTLT